GLEPRERLDRLPFPRAHVVAHGLVAGPGVDRDDLLAQPLARRERALVALQRERVLALARDLELARQHLRSLAHVEPADVVREALGERDTRREHARPEAAERG